MTLFSLLACLHPADPGALVPPTVDQDPLLPQVQLSVAGHERGVHIRTLGDPADPTVLMMHGSGSDHRAWLALEALSERYHLVLWDQRGMGLSERVEAEELSWDATVEEIDALVSLYSPDAPVTLVGHSWGGMLASLYLSKRPENVAAMVLIEPGPLDGEVMAETFQEFFVLDLTEENLNDQQWATLFLGPADHERLDHAYLTTLQGTLTRYHCDPADPPHWPMWRAGAFAEATRQAALRSGRSFDYDFAQGLSQADTPALVISTSCSALGTDFQERWHLPRLPDDTTVVHIEGAGHRVIAEQPEQVIEAIGRFLDGL